MDGMLFWKPITGLSKKKNYCRFTLTYFTRLRWLTRKTLVILSATGFTSILFFTVFPRPALAVESTFACGGQVEKDVWRLWDTEVKDYMLYQEIRERLLKRGDVYALYDIQTYLHNLAEMSQRCNRFSRLQEMARIISLAYEGLEPKGHSDSTKWICRGGIYCNTKNNLLYNEVPLDSSQFLALATYIANALATGAENPLSSEDKRFIQQTVQVAWEHMSRWADEKAMLDLQKSIGASPRDITNGSSALFFTDHHLWMITIYAEMSGIFNSAYHNLCPSVSPEEQFRIRHHFSLLLRFFNARLSLKKCHDGDIVNNMCADIDSGYWRLFADNRYAGYEGTEKPVICRPNRRKGFNIADNIPLDTIPKRDDIGWDISHSRRLVHALKALDHNRQSIGTFLGNDVKVFPAGIISAFANTVASKVWNGDWEHPLFSNYLCGANGWYRVAYNNGTGQCREGNPPYGLSDSFPTGGYIVWAKQNQTIRHLGKQIYVLLQSKDPKDRLFVNQFYESLAQPHNTKSKSLSMIMFLPSTVGVSIE